MNRHWSKALTGQVPLFVDQRIPQRQQSFAGLGVDSVRICLVLGTDRQDVLE